MISKRNDLISRRVVKLDIRAKGLKGDNSKVEKESKLSEL